MLIKKKIFKQINDNFDLYINKFHLCDSDSDNYIKTLSETQSWFNSFIDDLIDVKADRCFSHKELPSDCQEMMEFARNVRKRINETLNISSADILNINYLVKSIDTIINHTTSEEILVDLTRKTFELTKDLFLFKNCLEPLNKSVDDLYTLMNRCIILDHLSFGVDILIKEIRELNERLIVSRNNDFIIWYNTGLLNFKLHKYEKSLLFFEKAVKLLEQKPTSTNVHSDDQLKLYFKSKLFIVFSLEYKHEFDKAISELKELRERINKITDPDTKKEFDLEIIHALGHCCNEKAIKALQQTSDEDVSELIRNSRHYIEKACGSDISYKSCEGTILAEYNEYGQAIQVFEEALKDGNLDPALKNEIYFYKGYANYCLNKIDEAKKDFENFKNFCKLKQDNDALSHAYIFEIKAELRNRKIESIQIKEIESWIQDLQNHRPSYYVNRWVQTEWTKLLYLLKGFYYLKLVVRDNDSVPLMTVIDEIFYCFKKYVDADKLEVKESKEEECSSELRKYNVNGIPVYSISNSNRLSEEHSDNYLHISFQEALKSHRLNKIYDNMLSRRKTNNLFIACFKKLFKTGTIEEIKSFIEIAGQLNVIVYKDTEVDSEFVSIIENIHNNFEEPVFSSEDNNRAIHFTNFNDALKTIFVLNAFERILNDFVEPKHIFILAPLKDTKVFRFQTGSIEKLVNYDTNIQETSDLCNEDSFFYNQILFIEEWYNEKVHDVLAAENGDEIKEYFRYIYNNLKQSIGNRAIKFICYFPDNVKTGEYRIAFRDGDIDHYRKPLSNVVVQKKIRNLKRVVDKRNCSINCISSRRGCHFCCEVNVDFKSSELTNGTEIFNCVSDLLNYIPCQKITGKCNLWVKTIIKDKNKTIPQKASIFNGILLVLFETDVTEQLMKDVCKYNDESVANYRTPARKDIESQIQAQPTISGIHDLTQKKESLAQDLKSFRHMLSLVDDAEEYESCYQARKVAAEIKNKIDILKSELDSAYSEESIIIVKQKFLEYKTQWADTEKNL